MNGDIAVLEHELDTLLYRAFELDHQDIQLIEDTVRYTIGMFNSPSNTEAIQEPNTDSLVEYAQTYTEAINFYLEPVDKRLVATAFTRSESTRNQWSVLRFDLTESDGLSPNIHVSGATKQMDAALAMLHLLEMEKYSSTSYHRRSFRMFDREGSGFYTVKPAEHRFWTTGMALSDVDETINTLLQEETENSEIEAGV